MARRPCTPKPKAQVMAEVFAEETTVKQYERGIRDHTLVI